MNIENKFEGSGREVPNKDEELLKASKEGDESLKQFIRSEILKDSSVFRILSNEEKEKTVEYVLRLLKERLKNSENN